MWEERGEGAYDTNLTRDGAMISSLLRSEEFLWALCFQGSPCDPRSLSPLFPLLAFRLLLSLVMIYHALVQINKRLQYIHRQIVHRGVPVRTGQT